MNRTTDADLRNRQIARHEELRRICAQSWIIHPEWDADDHLAYLEQEGDDLDETITAVTAFGGPVDGPVRAYVRTWMFIPARGFEGI